MKNAIDSKRSIFARIQVTTPSRLQSKFPHVRVGLKFTHSLSALIAALLSVGSTAAAYGESVTYSVPVPEELQANATFQLKTAKINKTKTATGSHVQMVYQLPPELVGLMSQQIMLSGDFTDAQAGQPFQVSGPIAKAECQENSNLMMCQISMDKSITNPDAARFYLNKNVTDANQLGQLTQVMLRFSGDPIGVIRYQD